MAAESPYLWATASSPQRRGQGAWPAPRNIRQTTGCRLRHADGVHAVTTPARRSPARSMGLISLIGVELPEPIITPDCLTPLAQYHRPVARLPTGMASGYAIPFLIGGSIRSSPPTSAHYLLYRQRPLDVRSASSTWRRQPKCVVQLANACGCGLSSTFNRPPMCRDSMDVETFQPADAREWQQASVRFKAIQAQRDK